MRIEISAGSLLMMRFACSMALIRQRCLAHGCQPDHHALVELLYRKSNYSMPVVGNDQ